MREDFSEKMDEMFPEGYVVIYTCPDGQIRFAAHNPHKIVTLKAWVDALIQSGQETKQSNWMEETGGDECPPQEYSL